MLPAEDDEGDVTAGEEEEDEDEDEDTGDGRGGGDTSSAWQKYADAEIGDKSWVGGMRQWERELDGKLVSDSASIA